MELLENLFGIYVVSLYRECKRQLEIRSLTVALEAIKGMRKVVIIHYLSLFACMMVTAGLFVVVVNGLNQFEQVGYLYFDFITALGCLFMLGGGGAIFWFLREKRLIYAFGLQNHIERLVHRHTSKASEGEDSLTRKNLEILIDQLVKEKLDQMVKEAVTKRSSSQEVRDPLDIKLEEETVVGMA